MVTTFAEAMQEDRVSFEELRRQYNPVLQMVDVLIGVVPNCDQYLEVWKPGFRSYNLMVPNFLNLPSSLFGRSAPKDVVGLGMYTSSRAASCNYCSAHTCSFALRRGSSADAVTGKDRTPGESAAVAVAEALSYDQHSYTPDLGEELHRQYSEPDAEWIVMGVAMMGFLNKFMDALGVDLEPEAVGDVAGLIGPTGWAVGQHGWSDSPLEASEAASSPSKLPTTDSVSTILKVLRNAPGAVRLDREFMDGMPSDGAAARQRIRETYHYDEELLSRLMHAKPRRALAAMLRHNLDPSQSDLGVDLKSLAGLIYARHVGNDWLAEKSRALAVEMGIDSEIIESIDSGSDPTSRSVPLDNRTAAVVTGALAMSPSPAIVDAAAIATVSENLSSTEIVELAVWISISQLQHRLSLWYGLSHR